LIIYQERERERGDQIKCVLEREGVCLFDDQSSNNKKELKVDP
jgi:hypothetical protein